jgi:hypothetical protein
MANDQTIIFQRNNISYAIETSLYEVLENNKRASIFDKVVGIDKKIITKIEKILPNDIHIKLNELKINILLSDDSARDGLFLPDEDSAKKEINIILKLIDINSQGFEALLAHEFFHAIHFQLNPDEAAWVREGLAQQFEWMVTGEFNGRNLSATQKSPLTPLIANYNWENSDPAQYGHNLLYFYYMYNHCGGETFFWKLTQGQGEKKGALLINQILIEINSMRPECGNFIQSAMSFEIARAHNQIQLTSTTDADQYSLLESNLKNIFPLAESSLSLKKILARLPLLSSYKIPLSDFIKFQGQCINCKTVYAKRIFPFDVQNEVPDQIKNYDVILVKTFDGR